MQNMMVQHSARLVNIPKYGIYIDNIQSLCLISVNQFHIL